MAEIPNPNLHVGRVISDDPANGIVAVKNSDATVSNIVSRSQATGDVTHSAPANSSGTNTRRHLYDRPIVSTSTIEGTTIAATSFVGPLTGNVTGNITGTVLTAAQASITSLGTLTALAVAGTSRFNDPMVIAETVASAASHFFLTFRNEATGYGSWAFAKTGNNDVALQYGLNSDSPAGGTAFTAYYNGGLYFQSIQGGVPATVAAGGSLYIEAGVLKYKGSSGTVTALGAA